MGVGGSEEQWNRHGSDIILLVSLRGAALAVWDKTTSQGRDSGKNQSVGSTGGERGKNAAVVVL